MHITIKSRLPALAVTLGADLERELGAIVSISAWEPGDGYALRYRPMAAAQLQRLLDALGPMSPEHDEGASLGHADVELTMGWEEDDLRHVGVHMACENPALAAELAPLLADDLGMTLGSQAVGVCGKKTCYDVEETVPAAAREAIAYLVWKRSGVFLRPRVLQTVAPGELHLRLPDPAAGGPVQARVPIAIETDDFELAAVLQGRLEAQGFRDVSVGAIPSTPLTDEEELDYLLRARWPDRASPRVGFRLFPGALGADEHGLPLLGLRVAVDELLTRGGVQADRHPLLVGKYDEWADPRVRIVLPVAMARSGELRPYAGAFPERFAVKILSDDPDVAARLEARLRDLGHTCVSTDALGDERLEGFRLHRGATARHESIAGPLADAVRAEMAAAGVPREFALSIDDGHGPTADDVVITLPVTGAIDGSLLGEIMDRSRFTVKVHAPDPDLWRGFTEELEAEGWCVAEPEVQDAPRTPSIQVGGAPDGLVEPLARRLRERLGKPVRIRRAWGSGDCDVWIHLPSPPSAAPGGARTGRTAAPATGDAEAWFHGRRGAAPARAFIERTGDQLRVGEITLPCHAGPRHRLAPDPATFPHYTIDAATAGTLQHLALSVRLREPALLEGETSTSKTSSILYLAALLNQPVIRLNLNGQTDTSELIGRYVPAGPGTRGWHWQDGLLVQGMKQGFWVILDELNLAEPQVIERLNPVLESEPSLVLTEGDGTLIGAGGVPVHPAWRIFATQNPAAYAGRVPLSPAARDRWRALRLAPRPGYREYYSMLRRSVFGDQPDFELQGMRYEGERAAGKPGPLSQVPGIGPALRALATLHASLEEASAATEAGSARRDRQAYTRRSLLSVLGHVQLRARDAGIRGEEELLESVRMAVVRYYVERVPPADRAAVLRLAEAAGLAPREWGAAA